MGQYKDDFQEYASRFTSWAIFDLFDNLDNSEWRKFEKIGYAKNISGHKVGLTTLGSLVSTHLASRVQFVPYNKLVSYCNGLIGNRRLKMLKINK